MRGKGRTMQQTDREKMHRDATVASLTAYQWRCVFGTMCDIEDPPEQFDTTEELDGER